MPPGRRTINALQDRNFRMMPDGISGYQGSEEGPARTGRLAGQYRFPLSVIAIAINHPGNPRPRHPPSGVCRQSASAKTGGGDLRLDENRGESPEDSAPRRGPGGLGVHPHRRGVQSGANPQPDGGYFSLNQSSYWNNDNSAGNRLSKEEAARIYLRICPS